MRSNGSNLIYVESMVYLYSSGGREASLREREREKRQGGGIGEMKLIRNQLGCIEVAVSSLAGVA